MTEQHQTYWLQSSSPDPAATAAFYSTLLGWTLADDRPSAAGATMLCDGRPVAEVRGGASGGGWTVHLPVTDVTRTCRRVLAAGGAVAAGPSAGVDSFVTAVVIDPAGARLGLREAATARPTAADRAVAGHAVAGQVTWVECLTDDFAVATAFYAAVLGYHPTDLGGDGFRYATLATSGSADDDGQPVAGICLDAGQRPHWRAYIAVHDVDETARVARELGGSVLQPALDSPFGRWAILADPSGARFVVIVPTG